jgi:type II secretory pathway component GspD/PulD (secretin)
MKKLDSHFRLPPGLGGGGNDKGNLKVIFMAMGLWLWVGGNLYAQEKAVPVPPKADEAAPIPIGIEGKISLDFRGIDILDALKFLTVKVGLNIISTKNVTGKVTLTVDNVSIKDVFDIMLRSNGLAYVKQGDIYNVMTEEEYKAIYGRKFSDVRQVKTFRLQYAIPEQAFSMMDALKSDVGRVLVDPDSGTVLLMDTPDTIKRTEQALQMLERKNVVRTFVLKYAKAKDVEAQLKPQLDGKKVGFIKADDRSNEVIVQTLPERMEAIERLIKVMDQKTKEVLIEAKIVKISLSNELDTGVDWEGLMNVGSQLGATYLGSTPFSVIGPTAVTTAGTAMSRLNFLQSNSGSIGAGLPFSGNTSSSNSSAPVTAGVMNVGVISKNQDFNTVIKFLQTMGTTQVLANPTLAVVNNQEAKIHVGNREAYVTSTTSTGSTINTTSEQVTFVDVGIQLSVTPTINDDGYVTMKIKPEVSSVVSEITDSSGDVIPIINTSTAETTVMTKSGSTIIIGGLRQDEKDTSSSGIPILDKIPLIGWIFQSGSKTTIRTEMLVLLTPHIVTGDNLVAGIERELGTKPSKEYKQYKSFLTGTDLNPNPYVIDQKMRLYQEYGDINPPLKELTPTIKGDTSD